MKADGEDEMVKLETAKSAMEKKVRDQEKEHRKEVKVWKENIIA